ncbi:hypothetical protein ACWGH8_22295 [Nonomuraea muscovyensis]|uniref:Right handed beta helix domain-containing protein n=1 Tax=Nonomuraea muscovyensis TaxID=1124761 RepID=A0A7X0C5F3_9ACTN|nr:right-handed parallel beta-helix repeat-containing protein [Nonomuraea muscovyensis]MBB6347024.1 hypothetical protein [Nonomuraea muscovyensis]
MSGRNIRACTAGAAALALAITGIGAATGPASASAAAVYYLDSVNGDDAAAGTSAATAWRTLAKASAAPLAPGSRLLLRRGGSWTGRLSVTRSGTAAAPIVVDVYGSGARPVVKGDTESCVHLAGNHIELYNLQIGVNQDAGRCSWAAVKVTGDDNVVEKNHITGAAAGVFIEPAARYTAVTNNDFVDNNHMSTLTPTDVNDNDDSGAFAVLVQGDDSNIGWNRISGSIAFSYDYEWDGAAVEIFLGSRNHIHHNIAVDNDTFTELGTSTNADGTTNDPDGTSGNVFEYNAVYGPKTRAGLITRGPRDDGGPVDPNGPVLGTVFRNNSVHLTHPDAEGVVCYAGCANAHLSMAQNVVSAAKKSGYADPGFTDNHHNVFWGGLFQMPAGRDNVHRDPLFDPARPLRLRAGSPAIGLGVTGYAETDLDGVSVGSDGGIEAGAYEYVPAG